MALTEAQKEALDAEYLAEPDPEVIWLMPKCESLPSSHGDGRMWCEDKPEDCPECDCKPSRYVRSDLAWQPIETAPKDTAILVYTSGIQIAHFNTAYDMWIGYDAETADTKNMNRFNKPTHWMPLPPVPAVR